MDKSRQREYKRVESNLNIFRESIVFVASSVLWLYCITVLFVMVGSLLPIDNRFIQNVRVILNLEKSDIVSIFNNFVIGAIVITVYLMITFLFNVRRKRAVTHEYH
jgi:intracellular adhesion protein D